MPKGYGYHARGEKTKAQKRDLSTLTEPIRRRTRRGAPSSKSVTPGACVFSGQGPFTSRVSQGCSLTSWLWRRPSRSFSGEERFSGVRAQVSTCLSICPRSPARWVICVRSFSACGSSGAEPAGAGDRSASEGPGLSCVCLKWALPNHVPAGCGAPGGCAGPN